MSRKTATTGALTPLPAVAQQVELDDSVRTSFVELCAELHRHAVARSQQWPAQAQVSPPAPMRADDIERAIRYLESGVGASEKAWPTMPREFGRAHEQSDALLKFVRHPRLPLAAMIRVLCF